MKGCHKIIPLILLAFGIFILMQVFLPVVSYEIWEFTLKKSNQLLVSPQTPKTQVLGVSIENKDNFPAIVSFLKRESKAPFSQFSILIPRIRLEASVLVDSNDFSVNLAHLPGSALPGEKGNVFISGHSAGGFVFSKKQENYFAKLPDIKKGDEVIVTAGGSVFKYKVTGFKIISPDNMSVIYPEDEIGRYVSLMTCVPPGINTKRLVVIGKMI